MTLPQANRRDLGNLTSLGPRAGNAALTPQTRLPLEGSGGQGRGRKWTSEPSSLHRDQQALWKGAKDQLFPCLSLAPPRAAGK